MRFKIQVPEPSILMQTSSDPISLTPFSRWKLEIANEGRGEVAGLAGREEKLTWPKGYQPFYNPAHTEHVRYLWAGCFCSEFHSLNSNPLIYHFLIQKHVCP